MLDIASSDGSTSKRVFRLVLRTSGRRRGSRSPILLVIVETTALPTKGRAKTLPKLSSRRRCGNRSATRAADRGWQLRALCRRWRTYRAETARGRSLDTLLRETPETARGDVPPADTVASANQTARSDIEASNAGAQTRLLRGEACSRARQSSPIRTYPICGPGWVRCSLCWLHGRRRECV